MKKIYIKPSLEVVELRIHQHLLSGSRRMTINTEEAIEYEEGDAREVINTPDAWGGW